MPRGVKRQPVEHRGSIDGQADDAFSEIESLMEEIGEWKDNMEGSNMEHLPKYEEVSECVEYLESVFDDKPEMPDKLPAGLVDEVSWSALPNRKPSRAHRAGEAEQALNAVAEHLDAFLDEHNDEDACWAETDRGEWEQYAQDVRERADTLGEISFPGMY